MIKKRVLVTGATGLVGSHILSSFSNDYDVYALVRAKPSKTHDWVTYCEFDLTNNGFPECLPKKMDAIIHLAQSSKMRDFPLHALDIYNVNVTSTALLLDYGQKAGVTHFIFASTGGIYGASSEPCRENMPIQLPQGPLGYYFSSKYSSEHLVQSYAHLMSVHILRPFFIYGPNQKNDMFLPRLVDSVKQGKPITLQGENGTLVNPVHVNDVVGVIKECLSINDALTINVSGPDIVSIREISETIGDFVAKKPVFSMVAGNASNIIGNNDMMHSILNRPLIAFTKGIVDLF